jgi:hypothetical protein
MSNTPPERDKVIWLAIMTITSVLVSAGAAVLFRVAQAAPDDILTAAGAAFTAAMTLLLAIWHFVRPRL